MAVYKYTYILTIVHLEFVFFLEYENVSVLHYYQQTQGMPLSKSSVPSNSESSLSSHNNFSSLCLPFMINVLFLLGVKRITYVKTHLINQQRKCSRNSNSSGEVRKNFLTTSRWAQKGINPVPTNDLRYQRVQPQNWLNVPLPTRASWISERLFQSSACKSDSP